MFTAKVADPHDSLEHDAREALARITSRDASSPIAPEPHRHGALLSTLENINVDVTVVLGHNRMPVHMLLRMGRGAVVELAATETDMVEILANGHPIARGQIVVTGNRISVEITELIRKPDVVRERGVTIG